MSLSRRAARQWGDPAEDKPLSAKARRAMQELFGIPSEAFDAAVEALPVEVPEYRLSPEILVKLRAVAGAANVQTEAEGRARAGSGQSFADIAAYRRGRLPRLPEAVVSPPSEAAIEAILAIAEEHALAVVPGGGLTSVTGAIAFERPGILLDLKKHLNRVLEIDRHNLTATVEAGILGPAYEAALNAQGLTCGHFPQSFEFSTVGGWLAARGAGQQSTYYGKIEDMALGLRAITPRGVYESPSYARASLGPDWKQVFMGSEGCLGAITRARLRVFPQQSRRFFSFFMGDWDSGVELMRQITQAGFGQPGVFRLSDGEETEIGLQLAGMSGGSADTWLGRLGYKPNQRCLLIGTTEGDSAAALLAATKIHAMAIKLGGAPLGPGPVQKWWKDRYHHPYLRDRMLDVGIAVDTLETCADWSQVSALRAAVIQEIKSRPKTAALCHISHAYPSGANLYFIIMTPLGPITRREAEGDQDFADYHRRVVSAIDAHGGALSHHHGIGRLFEPWHRERQGAVSKALWRAVKAELDPMGIMNPGAVVKT